MEEEIRSKISNERFWNKYFRDFQVDNGDKHDVFVPIIFKYDNRFKNNLPVYKVIINNDSYFYIYFDSYNIYFGRIDTPIPETFWGHVFGGYYLERFRMEMVCPISYLPPTRRLSVNNVWLTLLFDRFISLMQGMASDLSKQFIRKHKFKKEIGKSINDIAVTVILTLRDKLPIEMIFHVLSCLRYIDFLL